jgi:glycosyltransferase involved in cell wall biosynthesis
MQAGPTTVNADLESSNRRLRIAIYAPSFAEYSTRLAMGLAREASVLLFLDKYNCATECDAALLEEARKSVRIVIFNSHGRLKLRAAMLQAHALMRLFSPDIVHVQEEPDQRTAAIVRRLGASRKMVLTVHDPTPHSGADAAYAEQRAAQRSVLRARADAFHVHGAWCRDSLISAGWTGKPIVSTPHGAILTPRLELRAEAEPGRILMFGRMNAYKGVATLIAAADLLRARGVPFRMVFAGRGEESARIRAAAEQHDDIEVMEKFLTLPEAIAQFQRAAMVATPYLDATQSGVVAAAFSNGRPVVASRTGGLVDIVAHEKNGLFVNAGDAAGLAEALSRLLGDEDLRLRLAAGAGETGATELDWGHISATLHQAYDALRTRSDYSASSTSTQSDWPA